METRTPYGATAPAQATSTRQATGAAGAAVVLGIGAVAASLCYAGLATWCWIAEETYDGDSLGVGYLLALVFGAIALAALIGGVLGLVLLRRWPRTAATLAGLGVGIALLPVPLFAFPFL